MSGLTVVISTFNGAEVLPEVLAGYAACKPPICPWELIIVDNGSNDNTPDLLRSFEKNLPLRILRHSPPGKNGCINRALTIALGDLIVLSDDDAIPDANFLCEWERMLTSAEAFDVFGGRIIPRFPAPIPSFLEKCRVHFPVLFAAIDLEDGQTNKDSVFGPNMAVRRRVFDNGFLFDEAIGPNSSQRNYMMGSESEFCDRMSVAGSKFWFNSHASVTHIVRPFQMTPEFMKARAFRHGSGVAYRESIDTSPALLFFRKVNWFVQGWRYLLFPGSRAEDRLWDFHWKRGYFHTKLKRRLG